MRALPLARALAQRGHDLCLIMPPWSYPQDSGQVFAEDGVRVINIALPPTLPLLGHLLIAWRLVRTALAQHPDVVHCFKPKAYAGLAALALWLARRLHLTQIRLVVDSDDWEGHGGWNEIERYSRLQKAFFAWQEHWGLIHADAITVASRTLQSIVWSLGVSPQKTFYLPTGIATNASHGEQPGAPIGVPSPTVLLYTRFFEFRLERCVEIIARVLHEMPQVHVVVVGAGLFGEEKQFLAQIESAGLSDRVHYVGWRDPTQLPAYFAAADVAIYPFDDTLINRTKCAVKLLDLLAACVPVVADRVGQNAEYIEHGVSGLLIEPGDTAGFVAAVVRLLNDENMRRSLGQNAHRRMVEQFTWARLAATAEEAYGWQRT